MRIEALRGRDEITSDIDLKHRESGFVDIFKIFKNGFLHARDVISCCCYDGKFGCLQEMAT